MVAEAVVVAAEEPAVLLRRRPGGGPGDDVVDLAAVDGFVAGGVLAAAVPHFDGLADHTGEGPLLRHLDHRRGAVEEDLLDLGGVEPGDELAGAQGDAVGELEDPGERVGAAPRVGDPPCPTAARGEN